MIRDHQVREIAHCLVLRSLQRQLTRLDLELVAAGGVGQETGRQQQVVEIDRRWRRWWWRRRGLTGSEHQRATKQNRQFPHRIFSPFSDCSGVETSKKAAGSYDSPRWYSGVEVHDLGIGRDRVQQQSPVAVRRLAFHAQKRARL